LRPLTIHDQYTNCATRLNIPNRTTTSNLPENGQNLYLPKMLSGANAFEISDIERMNIGARQPGV
jgi:hypothetical protein